MSGEEKEKGFRGRVKGAAAQAGVLIGLVVGLMALIDQVPTKSRPFLLAIGAIAAGALWWFLFHIATSKESYSRLDPEKKRYVHSKLRRIGAVSGLVIIPLAIGAVVASRLRPRLPDLKNCLTVAVARFKYDPGAIRDNLVIRLRQRNEYSSGIRLNPWPLEFEMEGDANAKASGFGHIVIWGGVDRVTLWLEGAVIEKCDPTKQSRSADPAAGSGTTFSASFKLGEGNQLTEKEMDDFIRFITGVALYEEGSFRESAELLETVEFRDSTLFKGMAYQKIALSSSEPTHDLSSAIRSYQQFFGKEWVLSPEDKEDPVVAGQALGALLNAGNATLESSKYDPIDAKDYILNAWARYQGAIDLYDYLRQQNIKLNDEQRKWKIDAQTGLAVAKAQFADACVACDRQKWLEEAEQDLADLLAYLKTGNQANTQEWANATANLGSVRIALSKTSDNPDRALRKAQKNFLQALHASGAIPSPPASSLAKARLCAKIGRVLIDRAEHGESDGTALRYLDRASEYFKEANEYLSQGEAESFDKAQNNGDCGLVLLTRAATTSPGNLEAIEMLQKASKLLTKSLLVMDRTIHPIEWALTTNSLARAKRELAVRLPDVDKKRRHLEKSVQLCYDSLRILGSDDRPHPFLRFYWALVKRNQGDCLVALGKETPGQIGRKYILQALNAYSKSRSVWMVANFNNDLRKTNESLANARALQPN